MFLQNLPVEVFVVWYFFYEEKIIHALGVFIAQLKEHTKLKRVRKKLSVGYLSNFYPQKHIVNELLKQKCLHHIKNLCTIMNV